MTRTMHDSFTKEWMQELLGDFGEVEIEKQLAEEVRNIDLVFFPNPIATPPRFWDYSVKWWPSLASSKPSETRFLSGRFASVGVNGWILRKISVAALSLKNKRFPKRSVPSYGFSPPLFLNINNTNSASNTSPSGETVFISYPIQTKLRSSSSISFLKHLTRSGFASLVEGRSNPLPSLS